MATVLDANADLRAAVQSCSAALQRMVEYRLDPRLDRRMLELGERKELLTSEEHDELQGLVAFSQERTIERLEAQAALNRLRGVFPDVAPSS